MKKILLVLITFTLTSCGTYQTLRTQNNTPLRINNFNTDNTYQNLNWSPYYYYGTNFYDMSHHFNHGVWWNYNRRGFGFTYNWNHNRWSSSYWRGGWYNTNNQYRWYDNRRGRRTSSTRQNVRHIVTKPNRLVSTNTVRPIPIRNGNSIIKRVRRNNVRTNKVRRVTPIRRNTHTKSPRRTIQSNKKRRTNQ